MRYLLLYIALFLCGHQLLSQSTLSELLQIYNTRSVPYISVEELKMLKEKEQVYLFDAREAKEHAVSRIPSATLVGFSEFSEELITARFPAKDSLIVVYCSLGIRSEEIAEKLVKAGYSNVRNLYGGIFEWKNKGYEVVDKAGNITDSVHTVSGTWAKWLKNGTKVY